MSRGTAARRRRTSRRAAQAKAQQLGVSKAQSPDLHTPLSAVDRPVLARRPFTVSGSTGLPLGARNQSWDATAADKAVRTWAGATDAPNAKYATAFFFKDTSDGPADSFGDYKLGFAQPVNGTLTANWGGITAVAGALQGARGGVQIPDADKAKIKTRVASYYAKARTKYNDPEIKVPWDAGSAAEAAALLAYAQHGQADPALLAVATLDWTAALSDDNEQREAFGGEPSEGTPRDRRLKENKPDDEDETATVIAAVGQVAFGPEDGFRDLRHDIAEAVCEMVGEGNGDGYIPSDCEDVSLDLTRALVCLGHDYFVVPITIGDDNEPTLADQTKWTPVDRGWVETPPEQDEDENTTAAVDPLVETLPDAHQPQAKAPRRRAGPQPAPEPENIPVMPGQARAVTWSSVFAPEGKLTSDGRAFAPGAITWRELPLSISAMTETSEGGHIGAEVAGRIDKIWRDDKTGLIRGQGVFAETDYGQMISGMVDREELRGVSVDLAIHKAVEGPRSDWFDAEGNWAPKPEEERTSLSPLDLLFGDESDPDDPPVLVVTEAEIGMVTICPFPAFEDARIAVGDSLVAGARRLVSVITVTSDAQWQLEEVQEATPAPLMASGTPAGGLTYTWTPTAENGSYGAESGEHVTASALGLAPELPPAEWFDYDDELTGPIVVEDDGHIHGYAATWNSCHIGYPNRCVPPPHSRTGYAYFHLGEVMCEDGVRVPVGTITLDTGHAPLDLNLKQATRHYDDTGTVAGYVRAYEDEVGIWVGGALAADCDADKAQKLRGAKLSGDWRGIDGSSEMVGLLAVNVPGFPIPRTESLTASGPDGEPELLALVAAGIYTDEFIGVVTEEEAEQFRALGAQARGEFDLERGD